MKKIITTLIIIGAIIVSIYLFGLITDTFRVYKVPTMANEPALKINSTIIASNLSGYNKGDFITYHQDTVSRVHRLIAVGGDKIEIKKGTVFVNGKDFDKELSLIHTYILTEKEYTNLKLKIELIPGYNDYSMTGQYMVFIEDKVAKENNLLERRVILEKDETDSAIQRLFGSPSNKDNLGQIIVPNGKIFVLGDNRDNSEDSRYLGFINESAIKGKVIR